MASANDRGRERLETEKTKKGKKAMEAPHVDHSWLKGELVHECSGPGCRTCSGPVRASERMPVPVGRAYSRWEKFIVCARKDYLEVRTLWGKITLPEAAFEQLRKVSSTHDSVEALFRSELLNFPWDEESINIAVPVHYGLIDKIEFAKLASRLLLPQKMSISPAGEVLLSAILGVELATALAENPKEMLPSTPIPHPIHVVVEG